MNVVATALPVRTQAKIRRLRHRRLDALAEWHRCGDELALLLLAAKEQHGYSVRSLGQVIGMPPASVQDFLKRAEQLREG